MFFVRHSVAALVLFLAAHSGSALATDQPADLTGKALNNPTAYIPPQCYTKTEDAAGQAHNPCFTCHVRPRVPNFINDRDLQISYAFPTPGLKNRWTNLFVDRQPLIAEISDAAILAYVREDNYHRADGKIALADALAAPPPGWDYNKNGRWDGFVPDVYFQFDAEGFDLAPDGGDSGWRVFAYTPAPGAFWPAAGSTDDVMIRLPEAYRETEDGEPSRAVYKLNLAITEALIKQQDVKISPTDETRYGVDLDKNGELGMADHIAFAFDPRNGITMSYVGKARTLGYQKAPLAAGLYPLGTEFAHSVRYLDIDDKSDAILMAPRMKEFRYMKKIAWRTYGDLEEKALAEVKEANDFPDRILLFDGDIENGIDNGAGWLLQGFIEDRQGQLRPQTFEETVFCMGCHGGLGVTDDSTFAFPRKLDFASTAHGWRHTGSKTGLNGVPDPLRADGRPEYQVYLQENHAGDEFRANDEIVGKFFQADGSLNKAEVERMNRSIPVLIDPMRERALMLNKAYLTIVREQSFALGRDANIGPLDATVHHSVEQDQPTGIEVAVEPWFYKGK
ncbi:MAG: hypothetical protein H6970_03015 [Gammaproteobacteria bacterium]|nr:hypothetical protein [Gammaproteobacteria bacterium]